MTESTNTFLNATIDDPEDLLLSDEGDFDPRVFWCVNGFLFFTMVVVMLWCCFADKEWLTTMHERRQQTDEAYQQALRERRQRRQQAKVDTPEKRTDKLLRSFERHKVQMTVQEQHLIAEDEASNEFEPQDLETSSIHNAGHLRLLTTGTLVPNCCAICLGGYSVGDQVVWSSNPQCSHAFHQDCVLGWLVKMQPETPCPCCRQEFTDLVNVRKESKIIWYGDAFNFGSIGFR